MMSEIRGTDILVSAEVLDAMVVVGGQRNATLNRANEVIDASSKVSGGWKKNIAGLKEWTVDADGLLVTSDAGYDALETAYMEDKTVKIEIAIGEGSKYTGEAIITDFPIEAPYDDVATYSISFTGTGALVKS